MSKEAAVADFYCDEVLTGSTKVDVVWESEQVLAFHHTQPYYEAHIVIIPKMHMGSLASDQIDPRLAVEFINVIGKVSRELEFKFGGCRVSSNIGTYQSTKHLHWYVHAGLRLRDEDGNLVSQIET